MDRQTPIWLALAPYRGEHQEHVKLRHEGGGQVYRSRPSGGWFDRRPDGHGQHVAVLATGSGIVLPAHTHCHRGGSAGYGHPACRDEARRDKADFENQRRFLSLDLLCGHPVWDNVRASLGDQGIAGEEHG